MVGLTFDVMDKVFKLRKIGTEEYYGRYKLGPIGRSASWSRAQDAKRQIAYASQHDALRARNFEIVEFKLVENRTAGYQEDWKFTNETSKVVTKTKDIWDE